MAHSDYHCCACCDCKLAYSHDATTKEQVCTDCLRGLHAAGVMVYTGDELAAWIEAHPDQAVGLLPTLGFATCWYQNAVDSAFAGAGPTHD